MITSYTENVSSIGTFRQDIPYLADVDEYSIENFKRMYLNKDNQFFYNLLTSSINFEGDFDPNTYYVITITKKLPWTIISYNEYRNINLWWLILAVNKISNPVKHPVPGTRLKILYPNYVRQVIDIINQKLK